MRTPNINCKLMSFDLYNVNAKNERSKTVANEKNITINLKETGYDSVQRRSC